MISVTDQVARRLRSSAFAVALSIPAACAPALRLAPDKADPRLAYAEAAARAGDAKTTRGLLEDAVRLEPDHVGALLLLGRHLRDAGELGVEVRTGALVTRIEEGRIHLRCGAGEAARDETIESRTVVWAAGVRASPLGECLKKSAGAPLDRMGRVIVEPDLSVPGHPEIFVIGDLANFAHQGGAPLPGVAPVAMQQGRYVARTIEGDLAGRSRQPFVYRDKGQLATIGRSRAIVEIGRLRFAGLFAWLLWIAVHIYYLTGFKNRLLVVIQWAWSWLTFRRGARLIVGKRWRFYAVPPNGDP